MTETSKHRNIEVTENGRMVASAAVTTPTEPHGTTRATFRAESGHLPPGSRSELVDAVLDLQEVRDSDRLEASVPIGDAETIARLNQRTTGMNSHAAGATALVDADITVGGTSDPEPATQPNETR
jgi:hypothetical protein